MRLSTKILLALVIQASLGWSAVIDSTLIGYWPMHNSLVDANLGGSTYDETMTGTVPVVTNSNCPTTGVATYVSFTGSNYIDLGPAAASALSSTANHTWGFYTYKNTRAANTYYVKAQLAGALVFAIKGGNGAADDVIVANGASDILTYSNTSGLQVCRYVKIVQTASSTLMYVSDNGGALTYITGTSATVNFTITPADTVHIGSFVTVATVLNGTLSELVCSNSSTTVVPYVPPTTAANTLRSVYLKNNTSPYLGKRR